MSSICCTFALNCRLKEEVVDEICLSLIASCSNTYTGKVDKTKTEFYMVTNYANRNSLYKVSCDFAPCIFGG